MSYKLFWSVFGGALCIASAVIPTLAGVTWWITALAVAIAGAIACMSIGSIVHIANMFKHLRYSQREQVSTLCRVAVGAYALWVILFVGQLGLWPVWAVSLIAIVGAVYWGCRFQEWRIVRVVAKEDKPQPSTVDAGTNSEDMQRGQRLLVRAGHPNVVVLNHEPIVDDDSGELIADQFLVRTPASGK